MTKVITQQFKEAQKNYSKYLKQLSQNEFSVVFDQANSFTISLPTNYPTSPPHISRGNFDFPTPMTLNWNSVFTLQHLIDHLQVCTSIPQPQLLELNKNEVSSIIKKSKPEAINTAENREKLLKSSSMPTTQKAFKQLSDVSGKIDKEQNNLRNLSKDISGNSKQASGRNAASNAQQVKSKDEAIRLYRSEARKINNDISEMKNNIVISDFQKYKQNLTDLYERMYLLEGTAQLLEDRINL